MCGPEWIPMRFAPSQALPDGYEVGAEWGERRDGTTGIGCYYWSRETVDGRIECGEPRATRWEARREALAHYRNKMR